MENAMRELSLQLVDRGYQWRIVPFQRLYDLQEEIDGRHRQRMFDDEFYQAWLAGFDRKPPDSLPGARSLIIVAIPRPQTQVVFHWDDQPRPLIIPPTYVGYDAIRHHVKDLLAGILLPAGFHVAPARLPHKLLAARSGLSQYGRNNISYVSGLGSFYQLVAVYSDMPCPQDNWQEAQMMERCQECQACLKHCPSGAISSDRFLLHAERCIVFHNEKSGQHPFPAWIDPAWHNCLIGCMHCQRVCPENRDVLGWIETQAEFSQEETSLLLEGVTLDQLPAATVEKLEQLELADSADILPRNLGVFFGLSRWS